MEIIASLGDIGFTPEKGLCGDIRGGLDIRPPTHANAKEKEMAELR